MLFRSMDENTTVSLCFDKELLYKNMVDAKADWLYNLPQWDKIFTPEKRKELYLEQKKSGTGVKAHKIGRNDLSAQLKLFTLFSLLLLFCTFESMAQEKLITINVKNVSLKEMCIRDSYNWSPDFLFHISNLKQTVPYGS